MLLAMNFSGFLLSLAYPGTLKTLGTDLIIGGLIVEALVIVVLKSGRTEKAILVLSALVIAGGVWLENIADTAIAAPRSLRTEDIAVFDRALRTVSGAFVDVYVFPVGTPDTVPLATSITGVLRQAGWTIGRVETAAGGQYFVGVGVWVKPNADDNEKKAHDALTKLLATLDPNLNPDMSVTAGAFTVGGTSSEVTDWTRVPAPLAVLVGTKP